MSYCSRTVIAILWQLHIRHSVQGPAVVEWSDQEVDRGLSSGDRETVNRGASASTLFCSVLFYRFNNTGTTFRERCRHSGFVNSFSERVGEDLFNKTVPHTITTQSHVAGLSQPTTQNKKKYPGMLYRYTVHGQSNTMATPSTYLGLQIN